MNTKTWKLTVTGEQMSPGTPYFVKREFNYSSAWGHTIICFIFVWNIFYSCKLIFILHYLSSMCTNNNSKTMYMSLFFVSLYKQPKNYLTTKIKQIMVIYKVYPVKFSSLANKLSQLISCTVKSILSNHVLAHKKWSLYRGGLLKEVKMNKKYCH